MIMIPSDLDAYDLKKNIAEFSDADEKEAVLAMIRRNGLDSWFQPIVDLLTNRVFGYEMLARGQEPFFSPSAMFQAAERNGIEWDLEYACRLTALNKIAGLDKPFGQLYFFLNVSPHIFNNPEFKSGFTSSHIKSLGLNHKKIVLEITEKASIERHCIFEKLIRHYVGQGFKVALDDFGAGHSGLTTLVAMTPHFMKIDREIIIGIGSSPYKQNLLRTLCGFASDVGSHILAEGIENFDDLETVYRLGVRYAQGYYLGEPSPAPRSLPETLTEKLQGLNSRFKIADFSTGSFVNDIIVKPDTFRAGNLTCRELDNFFQSHQMADHVVIVKDKSPVQLVTRQNFNKRVSGRFGFSLNSMHQVDEIINTDFIVLRNDTDLLAIKKIALGRKSDEAFDPILIVDDRDVFIGTITMKKLIEKAVDLEIYNAINRNPLTYLPGNSHIRLNLKHLTNGGEYSVVYVDIDHFKRFNDTFGFDQGDRMISLLADILKKLKKSIKEEVFLGHIGGDDFILLFHCLVDEQILVDICHDFDKGRIVLFNKKDVEKGSFSVVDRKGDALEYPLTTISIAAFSSTNFNRKEEINPGALAHHAAELKSKVKKENAVTGKSGYIYERRVY